MSAPAWRNRIVSYDTKPASQFAPNPLNWRTHPSVQREALRGLLGDVGWVGAVLENKQTGNLIDGHARIEEALNEDSTQLIPYLLVDLTPEEEKLVLASFDPISALATADSKRLEELLKDVSSSSQAVDSMLAELAKEHGVFTADEPKDAEPQIDKAAELQQKWGTETGQLWVIGNHRLLVGDATNKGDVGRVLRNERPLLVLSDPPYGVDYDGGTTKRERLAGDKSPNLYAPFLQLIRPLLDDRAGLYLFYADGDAAVTQAVTQAGFVVRNTLIWNKNQAQFGALSAQYKQKHEPFLYCHIKGKSPQWFGPTNEVTVWDCNRAPSNDLHPTQKPVELFERALRNSSKQGDVILEGFAGSGTALVACENLGRYAYCIEISPAYVAVCLERMTTAFPHLKIEKVDQARAA